jgi:putative resolvase
MTSYDKDEYLRPKDAANLLKVSISILKVWDASGKIKSIRTQGGHRRFLRSSLLPKLSDTIKNDKKRICYCRVSTYSQKEDLDRQVAFFRDKFPNHEIIKDIGSGLNYKRKGYNTILDHAIKGNIQEVVVTHKDRLCRFGFESIDRIIREHSNGTIVVLNQTKASPESELVNDLLSIITVFSSRLYGLRSHSIKNQIKAQTCQNTEDAIVPNVG